MSNSLGSNCKCCKLPSILTLWTNCANRKTSNSEKRLRSTPKVSLLSYISCPYLLHTHSRPYPVNTTYQEIKNKTAQLLNQIVSIKEERPEHEQAEIDRIVNVRKHYFDQLAAYDEALEEFGRDVTELARRGIEKPVPGEDVQDGDLRSLEELEVAYGTVQEQLEYNNNKDESVVKSYEEKKNTVRP